MKAIFFLQNEEFLPKHVDFYRAFLFQEFSLERSHQILKGKKSLFIKPKKWRKLLLRRFQNIHSTFRLALGIGRKAAKLDLQKIQSACYFLPEKENRSLESPLAPRRPGHATERTSAWDRTTGTAREMAAPAARCTGRDLGRRPGTRGHARLRVSPLSPLKTTTFNARLPPLTPGPGSSRLHMAGKGQEPATQRDRFQNGLLPHFSDLPEKLRWKSHLDIF